MRFCEALTWTVLEETKRLAVDNRTAYGSMEMIWTLRKSPSKIRDPISLGDTPIFHAFLHIFCISTAIPHGPRILSKYKPNTFYLIWESFSLESITFLKNDEIFNFLFTSFSSMKIVFLAVTDAVTQDSSTNFLCRQFKCCVMSLLNFKILQIQWQHFVWLCDGKPIF